MRRHHTGNKFYRGHIALEASRQSYPDICYGMLVVDGDHRQALVVPNVAAKRLKVSDHQVDLVFINQMRQLFQAAYSARRLDQVAGQRSLITHAIIYVSEAQAKNFSDSEALTQVAQPAVKRHYLQLVSLLLQVSDDFPGARGVARAFTVHTIENVGHVMRESISFRCTRGGAGIRPQPGRTWRACGPSKSGRAIPC